MTLNGIEIEVGMPSEKHPTCRHLTFIVSFENDSGKECLQREEILLHERVLYDPAGIARIVVHVLRGLLMEIADLNASGSKLQAEPAGARFVSV
jgi:hypothetical protein